MNIFKRLLGGDPPEPSDEALRERAEVEVLRARAHRVMSERRELLAENNYTARIRALYEGRT